MAWIGSAVGDRFNEVTGKDPYAYTLNGRAFGRYGMEQQAQMVENCVRGSRGDVSAGHPVSPEKEGRNDKARR